MDLNSQLNFRSSRRSKKILIAEDDKNLGWMLQENINASGYDAELVGNGEDVLKMTQDCEYDLLILDVMMPKLDGIEVCKRLKKERHHTPVLFLTARALKSDIIDGFDAGADDYVIKPFDLDELLCRIRAVLHRSDIALGSTNTNPTPIHLADALYDPRYRSLTSKKVNTRFSATENKIFALLANKAAKTVSRAEILISVWGRNDEYTSKALDVHLTKIRKMIKPYPMLSIENIHGLGYRLSISDV